MHSVFLTESDFTRVMALQPDPSLRAELERAIVVDSGSIPPDVVTMYSVVRYRDAHTGAARQVQIVYPEDADAGQGRISVLAPVGAALLGLEAGRAVDWTFPGGETRRLHVEEVLHQPARPEPSIPRMRESSGDAAVVMGPRLRGDDDGSRG